MKSESLSELLQHDSNVLIRSSWESKKAAFMQELHNRRQDIAMIVKSHCHLTTQEVCTITPMEEWLCGSFNVCIPITIQSWTTRVIMKFPMPHRGTPEGINEKLLSEAATYAWTSDTCVSVPIPRIWGYGTMTGQSVHIASASEEGELTFSSSRLSQACQSSRRPQSCSDKRFRSYTARRLRDRSFKFNHIRFRSGISSLPSWIGSKIIPCCQISGMT